MQLFQQKSERILPGVTDHTGIVLRLMRFNNTDITFPMAFFFQIQGPLSFLLFPGSNTDLANNAHHFITSKHMKIKKKKKNLHAKTVVNNYIKNCQGMIVSQILVQVHHNFKFPLIYKLIILWLWFHDWLETNHRKNAHSIRHFLIKTAHIMK